MPLHYVLYIREDFMVQLLTRKNRLAHEKYIAKHRMENILADLEKREAEDYFDFVPALSNGYKRRMTSDLEKYRSAGSIPLKDGDYDFVNTFGRTEKDDIGTVPYFKDILQRREYTNEYPDSLFLYSYRENGTVPVAKIDLKRDVILFRLDDFIDKKISDEKLAHIVGAAGFIKSEHYRVPV